jgi:lysophospholipase L1-like esterase
VKRSALLFWLVAALLLLGPVVFWRFRNAAPDFANFPPSATGPWIAMGDSLTEGRGSSRGNDYPSVLARNLGIPILNLGRSGETSADGLRRLDTVLRQNPRVVLLCYGGNDALQQLPIEQTRANLRAMIERMHGRGAFVVLIGIRSASLLDRNGDHFARLAGETRVLHVEDFLDGLAFKPIYMTDAVHPNDAGYQRFAERLEGILKPHLETLRAPAASR